MPVVSEQSCGSFELASVWVDHTMSSNPTPPIVPAPIFSATNMGVRNGADSGRRQKMPTGSRSLPPDQIGRAVEVEGDVKQTIVGKGKAVFQSADHDGRADYHTRRLDRQAV